MMALYEFQEFADFREYDKYLLRNIWRVRRAGRF
jgi:hypothetical protein